MFKKRPALLAACAVSGIFLLAACERSSPEAKTIEDAVTEQKAADHNIHGWDRMENAEFVMEDVPMKFLFPRPGFTTTRDVAVDCDLLLRSGERLARGDAIPTNGFAMQFNAETDYTRKALEQLDVASGNAPGTALNRIQAWSGQLDPRGLNGAINTHLSPQHGITIDVLREAANICIDQHSDHGIKIAELRAIAGGTQGIHPDWTNDR